MYVSPVPQIERLPVNPSDRPDVLAFAERFLTRRAQADRPYGYTADTLRTHTEEILQNTVVAESESAIGTYVVKTVTDCNLRCQYPCYEYNDDSWRALPPVMPDTVVAKVGSRIGAYASQNALQGVGVVFHGGEPLYMPKPEVYYNRIIPLLLDSIAAESPDTVVSLDMQTNGILLRPAVLDILKRYNVGIGVSLDGNKLAHDAKRLTKNGKGSYDMVMRGLAQLSQPRYAHLMRSLLCVININSDPLAVDDTLRQAVPSGTQYIDYLLPYATPDHPPPQPSDPERQTETPYADWLLPIFWRTLRKPPPHVRLFTSMMQLTMGGESSTEAIGPIAGGALVIRTDGSYELLDALKAIGPDATTTNMHLDTHAIEDVARMLRSIGHLGKKITAAACEPCAVRELCGGGHIASRYSTEKGFDNVSAYCKDLELIAREVARATRYHTYSAVARVLHDNGIAPDGIDCC